MQFGALSLQFFKGVPPQSLSVITLRPSILDRLFSPLSTFLVSPFALCWPTVVHVYAIHSLTYNAATTTAVLRPLYRSNCISWHLQLRTGCSLTACMPWLTATSTFWLGGRHWSSSQQCYLHCLHTILTFTYLLVSKNLCVCVEQLVYRGR